MEISIGSEEELLFACDLLEKRLWLTISERSRQGVGVEINALKVELTTADAERLIGVLAAQLAIERACRLRSPTETEHQASGD